MNEAKDDVCDYEFKVLLLGDSSVGKTCFFLRVTENVYMESHLSTIGIDTAVKYYEIKDKETSETKKIKLRINDTAGQDRFRAITASYFKQADGVLLLYDITKQESFDHINDWINQVQEKASKDVRIFLVGNKIDLRGNPEFPKCVSKEEGQALADKLKVKYKEGSAKEDIGVRELFEEITSDIYEIQKNSDRNNQGPQFVISSKEEKEKRQGGGCCGRVSYLNY